MPGCGPLSSSTRTPGSGGNSAPRGGTTSAARSMRSVSVTPSLLCKYQTTFVLLESYNEAVTFSSGKGLAHTLARRAGFLLQTGEHMLALRDLHLGARTENRQRKQNIFKGTIYLALEYGCLENELLDGLMDHHNCGNVKDLKVGKSWEKKYASR